MDSIVLKMSNIHKSFPGVKALKGVSMELYKGEIHALLGENGAGKSTLIKCLAGIYSYDEGEIEYCGRKILFKNPMDSMNCGISVIHQELVLAEQLTAADNMFSGQEPVNRFGFIDRKKMHAACNKILESLGVDFNSHSRVYSLSTAQKQMLEIAKAVSRNSQILVMDEPTAAVSHKEVEKIFEMIEKLKKQQISIIYISHRMDEIFRIADRITVLRDGANAGTVSAEETQKNHLVKMMVGYHLEKYYSKTQHKVENVILECRQLTRKDHKVRNADFTLRKGEIIGFAGLVGSGRTELVETLFGLSKLESGSIFLNGKEVQIHNPRKALASGICLVPEDRKKEGLFLDNTVRFNLTIAVLKDFMRGVFLNKGKEASIERKYIEELSIKTSFPKQKANDLSGGNQQKIVLGKWLAASKEILILDEPTRGVDVGAKAEIYALMDRLTTMGVSIIMVSSELPEVINMSDRIYVMRDGEIKVCFDRENEAFQQEKILEYALGVK